MGDILAPRVRLARFKRWREKLRRYGFLAVDVPDWLLVLLVQVCLCAFTLLLADAGIRTAVLGEMTPHALKIWITAAIIGFVLSSGAQVFFSRRAQALQPPADFLRRLQRRFALAHAASTGALSGAFKTDELFDIAVVLLEHIAGIASEYLGGGNGARFSANVMIYRDEKYVRQQAEDLNSHLLLADPGTDVARLPGALELLVGLNGQTSSIAGEKLPRIVLPIFPAAREPLPGAPEALRETDRCFYYEDTYKVAERCRDKGCSDAVVRAAELYFRDQLTTIRSFFSVALLRSFEQPGKPQKPIGVLNINCSEPRMFKSERQQEALLPHVAMIAYLLAEVVAAAYGGP